MLLSSTQKLQVVLSGVVATAQLPIVAGWADSAGDASTLAPASATGATNSTTAVDIVPAPAATFLRQLKYLSAYNADTAAATLTVRLDDGGTPRILCVVTLAVGSRLEYTAEGFRAFDSAGALVGSGGGGSGSGDFTGPGSSTDNALVRFDGTGGKTGQSSGVLVTDANEISGYKGNINRQTGTSYTLVAADSGKILELANAASIALTADPTLPAGFCCTIVQALAGVATIASSGSGTVVNRQSQFKTAGTDAICTVYVRSNSGSNAVFVFGGDTAA